MEVKNQYVPRVNQVNILYIKRFSVFMIFIILSDRCYKLEQRYNPYDKGQSIGEPTGDFGK